jgi:hypothetical protein
MTKGKWETVPGGLGGPTYLKRKVVSDDLVLEKWHHPQWSPALKALAKGKTELLGELLRGGGPVPEEVAKTLGTMLDPTPEYRGTRLEARVPKRWTTRKLAGVMRDKREARKEIEVALELAGGKLEAALASVIASREAQGKHHSRRYLLQAWTMGDGEAVLILERGLGGTLVHARVSSFVHSYLADSR